MSVDVLRSTFEGVGDLEACRIDETGKLGIVEFKSPRSATKADYNFTRKSANTFLPFFSFSLFFSLSKTFLETFRLYNN